MNLGYDLVRVTTPTVGTGAIVLGPEVPGYLNFSQSGVPNGAVLSYGISDGPNSEVGWGVYNTSGPTLTRNVYRSTGNNSPLTLSGAAQVFICPLAEDLAALYGTNGIIKSDGAGNISPAIPNQDYLISNQMITISGDADGSGTTAITVTLDTINGNVGTFQGLTVDGKGRVTAATNQNYASNTALDLKEDKANRGIANGYASLDAGIKVPAAQLPSYVDDVQEFANLGVFPVTGSAGIIYVALDTNRVYRWSGTVYVEISPSPGSTDAVPEGSTNLYYTTARASAVAPVQSVAGRAGAVTLSKTDVSLGNVDNTSDVAKPVSTAQQAAFDLKASLASPVFTGTPSLPTGATAVTQIAATSNTTLATTAYVKSNIPVPLTVALGGTGGATAAAALTSLGAVAKAGDTMTGSLTIAPTGSTDSALTLNKSAAAANSVIYAQRGGSTRWTVNLAQAVDTGSGNGGSDFSIDRYSDAGAWLGSALSINRATGNATFSGSVASSLIQVGSATTDLGQVGFTANNNGPKLYFWGTGTAGSGSITTTGTLWCTTDNVLSCGLPGGAWQAVHSYAFTNASDPALKRDIAQPPPGALAHVHEIAAATYRWKDDPGDAPTHWGFLATDVQAAMGADFGGVVEDKETGIKGLNYHELTAVLWAAVQELSAKVQALEAAK